MTEFLLPYMGKYMSQASICLSLSHIPNLPQHLIKLWALNGLFEAHFPQSFHTHTHPLKKAKQQQKKLVGFISTKPLFVVLISELLRFLLWWQNTDQNKFRKARSLSHLTWKTKVGASRQKLKQTPSRNDADSLASNGFSGLIS